MYKTKSVWHTSLSASIIKSIELFDHCVLFFDPLVIPLLYQWCIYTVLMIRVENYPDICFPIVNLLTNS